MAVGEHAFHVGDIACVTATYVQRGEGYAVVEHLTHVGDVARIQVVQVQGREGGAVHEHIKHIGDTFELCNWNTPIATSVRGYCIFSVALPYFVGEGCRGGAGDSRRICNSLFIPRDYVHV